MPLHPLAQRLLERMSRAGLPSFENMTVDEARQAFAIYEGLGGVGPEVADVVDLDMPGPGGALHLRLYVPDGAGPHPVLVWCQGGGWIMGNIAVADTYCRWLCKTAGCAVLSPDFRDAPEHPFPAAIQDCYAAARYISSNSQSMGLDRTRMAIGGESTGANLAAATAIVARDRGDVAFKQVVLFFPVVDPTLSSRSARDFQDGFFFSTKALRWFWSQWCPSPDAREQPLADLLHRADLDGLPPTFVGTAEYDAARDEGEQFAAKLASQGVQVESKRYDGMIHGFLGLEAMFEAAQDAYEDIAVALHGAWR